MTSVPTALLQSIADVLARVPVDPADLAANVAQLGAQLDGLARLDDLDLLNCGAGHRGPSPDGGSACPLTS